MTSFIDSPVWGAVVTVGGTGLLGLIGMMARLIRKVNKMDTKLDTLNRGLRDMRNDKDIVRWSDVRAKRKRGKKDVF